MDTASGKTSAEYQLQVVTHARTVMAECIRVLVRASDENQLLQDMCRVVVASGRYRMAWIGMVEHDAGSTIRPVASAGDASGHLTTTRISWGDNEFGQGPGGIAVRTRKPHAVRRIDSDPYFATLRRDTVALGYRSAAALPLLIGEEAIGIIGILAEDPDAFDRDEVALLEELANDIAFGLSTLRLRATQRRANQLQELEHAVAHCLAQSENVAEAMPAVIRAICETENWEVGRYFRVDRAARELRLEHAWHIPEHGFAQFVERSRGMRYSRGSGLAGLVWESGEPLWSPDRNNDPRALRTHSIEIGLRASFVFPVTAEAQTIGVLSFSTRRPRDPDEGLLKAVRALGSQIGQFLRRKEAEAVLRESEARFRSLTSLSSDWYWEQDSEYRFVQITDDIDRKTGVSSESHIGKRRWELDAPNMSEADWAAHRAVIEAHQPFHDLELCRLAHDGRLSWMIISGEPIFDAGGQFKGYRGIGKDITARKETEEKILAQALQQHLLAEFGQQALASNQLMEVLNRAVELVSGTLRADYCSVMELDAKTQELTYRAVAGWPADWVGSRRVPLQPGGYAAYTLSTGVPLVIENHETDTRFARSALPRHVTASSVRAPILGSSGAFGLLTAYYRNPRHFTDEELNFVRTVAHILSVAIERKNAEEKFAFLAQFDAVTGLPNRHLFRDRLGQAVEQARREGPTGAMLFIDLDRFKVVNDTFGHATGDRLLAQAAARIKACMRSMDTVARLSGDEFGVVLLNLSRAELAAGIAQKVINVLGEGFDLEGHHIFVSASIGIALFPTDGTDPETLTKNADTAMYRAKEQGRACYRFYLPQMNDRLFERLQLETSLRGALERGEFHLHFQPKVRLDTGAISGFEALLRWNRDGKLVSPAEFIPVLEDTGLIVPVGEWVLREVCRCIKAWMDAGLAPRPVAVNLSARQFQHKNLVAAVRGILAESAVAPGHLELELTESLLMSDAEEAVQMLHELKSLGVHLSVDDFGTGYSSLAYLKRFPLDVLKIDRAFIRDVVSDADDATLTVTIINLAHSMRLRVVAEGVETEAQLTFLLRHGCDELQGYYFARPLEIEDCRRMLEEDRRLKKPDLEFNRERPTVLIVDDDRHDLELMTRALAADDLLIRTADSAHAAFELLALHGADIIVTDYRMPGTNGIDFLGNVRKLYPSILRTIITGTDEPPTLSRAVNSAGIHKYLSKSWSAERLRAEVRQTLFGGAELPQN